MQFNCTNFMRALPESFRDGAADLFGRRGLARAVLSGLRSFGGISVAVAALILVSVQPASAANDNWTSTASTAWGTAGNWSAGVPTASSSLFFNTAAGQQTAIALSSSSLASSLTFNSTGGANAFTFDTVGTVNTNTLTVSGGIVNSDAALQTFYNKIVLGGNQSWTATSGGLSFNGNVSLGSGANSYTLTVNGANAVAIAGTIANGGTPAGNLIYSGTSNLTLTGANTYTGTTTVSSGTLTAGSATALGTTAAGTTVASGATLAVQGGITVAEGLNISGSGATTNTGALSNASGTNTVSGAVVQSAASTISAAAGSQLTVSGAISGSFPVTYGKGTGTGTVVVSGANTYVGATNVDAGTLKIQSAGALGTASNTAATTVANGATLQVAGGIVVTNTGTIVLNGTGSGLGSLQNVSGSNTLGAVSLASNSTIYSATAGNLLTLGGTSYTNALTFAMGSNTVTFDGPGDTWLNSNAGVAGDTGGLIKNGTGKLTLYGYNTFYTGATVVNAGSLDLTVGPFNAGIYGINGSLTIGAGSSNPALAGTVNVNIATNSYANQLSPTSAVTINSDGALNVGSSTGLGSLTLNGGKVAITSGMAISPSGNITSNTNSASQTSLISGGQVTLAGPTTVTVARDSSLTSDLTISSTIAGGSLNKQGAGVLTLSATNTIGATAINAGVVNAQAANALGTTGAVTVANGAALQVQGGVSLGQTGTTLNGTGISNTGALRNVSGNNTLAALITLGSASRINSDAGTITLAGGLNTGGNDLTIGGAGATSLAGTLTFGSSTVTKLDSGTLTFASTANLSTGTFLLNAGTLALGGGTTSIGTLHITGDSILDFGNALASTLNVTNFIIDSGVSLTITNWVNSTDFFYAQNWAGATLDTAGTSPMNRITFSSFSNNSTRWLGSNKQVTPVPEPATYGAWLMGLMGAVFVFQRRRRRA